MSAFKVGGTWTLTGATLGFATGGPIGSIVGGLLGGAVGAIVGYIGSSKIGEEFTKH